MAAPLTKILAISDHPLIPSGVGTQARYVTEGLLATGRYEFVTLGGALQHADDRPAIVEPEKYGERWKIYPVHGYGDKATLRRFLAHERPDALWFITDPRFYVWLWEMEDEIHQVCPMLYWHVWDNDPTPDYNVGFYESTDFVASISLKTQGLLDSMGIKHSEYVPHAVAPDIFRPVPREEALRFKRENYGPHAETPFVVFWNNRNARRKCTGDVVAAFADFASVVGSDKVALMLHTDPRDNEGQDVLALARKFGVEKNMIVSNQRIEPEHLNMYYNVADVTMNIAFAEGFGLGTLESLYAGTPIVANFTGGLQFQLGDWWQSVDFEDSDLQKEFFSSQEAMTKRAKKQWASGRGNWWGAPVFPASRGVVGSQQIPYIYEDRVAHKDVVKALEHVYGMSPSARQRLGLEASKWARETFGMEQMISRWDKIVAGQVETFRNRKRATTRQVTI